MRTFILFISISLAQSLTAAEAPLTLPILTRDGALPPTPERILRPAVNPPSRPEVILLPGHAWKVPAIVSPTAADVVRASIIPVGHSLQLSVHHRAQVRAIERVLVVTAEGRLLTTAPLTKPSAPWHLPISLVRFTSPDPTITIDKSGVVTAEVGDALKRAARGFVIEAHIGAVSAPMVITPDFALPDASCNLDGADGTAGQSGASGKSGIAGRSGASGRSGSDGQDGNRNGSEGGAGDQGQAGSDADSGTPGGHAGAAGNGGDGGDAAPVVVAIDPVPSPFTEKPLWSITYRQGNRQGALVVPWGNPVRISARAGAGGAGGAGGQGGSGGAGGDGGAGGAGGDGGSGGTGDTGFRGDRGTNASDSSDATRGEDGGDGGVGGIGGRGGSGGIGGIGGNGSAGGQGSNGGLGGHGGKGALVTITLTGDPAFQEMVKASLSIDVRGGEAGAAGSAGSGGFAGRAGNAGAGGLVGQGGDGGDGGDGGPGGDGGDGGYFKERGIDGNYYQTVKMPGGDGSRGDRGRAGPRGSDGMSGRQGQPGAMGTNGVAGVAGQPGTPGGNGTVVWSAP